MKILGAVAGAFLVVGALAGCNAGADLVPQVEDLSKKMCACADKECTGKVAKEISDWLTANKDKKTNKANLDKMNAAMKAAGKCAEEKGDAEAAKVDDAAVPIQEGE